MSESKVYPVKAHISNGALLDKAGYEAMYRASVQDPDAFWGEQGKILDWMKPYTRVKNTSYDPGHVSIKWYEDGLLNVSANCLDRHLAQRGDKVAIIWEGDNPAEDRKLTYRELHTEVCKFANVLKAQGVHRGDVVCLYMPMVPEAAIAMLACTRIGAVHSIVFGGFSPEALAGRIIDSGSSIVITADEGLRGGRPVPLKKNVDEALTNPETKVNKVIVLKRTGGNIAWHNHRDIWWHDAVATVSADCPPEAMGAEDPLFILYTSGSTGKPKGVLHTTGGYLVYATLTFKYIFDYHEEDIYWCTADVGWVTGHSYLVYGPLANGATTIMFEGVPNYPATNRMSQVVDKHQVSILYTAPRHPRADGQGQRGGRRHFPFEPAHHGLGGRAHQPGSLGVVLPHHRRGALPHRRYLVADRDRRHPHQPAARRHRSQARLGYPSLLRRAASAGGQHGRAAGGGHRG